MKVVVNRCFGCYSLSNEAMQWLAERSDAARAYMGELGSWASSDKGHWHYQGSGRTDPLLVECVETLGSERASGLVAKLEVVEIPDGIERVDEAHRSW